MDRVVLFHISNGKSLSTAAANGRSKDSASCRRCRCRNEQAEEIAIAIWVVSNRWLPKTNWIVWVRAVVVRVVLGFTLSHSHPNGQKEERIAQHSLHLTFEPAKEDLARILHSKLFYSVLRWIEGLTQGRPWLVVYDRNLSPFPAGWAEDLIVDCLSLSGHGAWIRSIAIPLLYWAPKCSSF